MLSFVSGAVRASLVTFLLCGLAYPLVVTGISQVLMPFQANGSLEKTTDGKIIGSRLIGQKWNDPQWFHGRPSATVNLSDSTKISDAAHAGNKADVAASQRFSAASLYPRE